MFLLLYDHVGSLFDLSIRGRVNEDVSLGFVVEHASTIFIDGNNVNENFIKYRNGIDLRILWWTDLYNQLISNFKNLFFDWVMANLLLIFPCQNNKC